jgi:hypothetical protein
MQVDVIFAATVVIPSVSKLYFVCSDSNRCACFAAVFVFEK